MHNRPRTPAHRATGRATARRLLDIKAVNFRPAEPYTLTAGWVSPVYVDCRSVISYPAVRRLIIADACERIEQAIGFSNIDVVAGGETAGIPYAAWIAEARNQPMVYVRKKPKGFGSNARIEGTFGEGACILLVEDLATDGGSKINFVNALRDAGATVSDSFVVFFYGVFASAEKTLADAGIALHYLADWWDVLAEAEAAGDFPAADLGAVRAFLNDPAKWSADHGGRRS